VADASSALIGLTGHDIRDAVRGILQRLVEATHVDRATLIELVEGSDEVAAVHSSARLGLGAEDTSLAAPEIRSILEQLRTGEDLVVLGGPGADAPDRALWASMPAVAVLVNVGGSHRNALVLQTVGEHQAWPDRKLKRLRLLAEIVAGALYRAQQDRALQNQHIDSGTRSARLSRRTEGFGPPSGPGGRLIVGTSPVFQAALKRAQMVARTNATVLLQGETGTGKELFAQAIHSQSARGRYPLISVNCVALPPSLIESELFGHERGAFTGAVAKRSGRFELADRGTLFLDEIGDLPLELQAKLLRVLQERSFERVGASHTQKVDVRIIAATNRNLETAIASGQFREDLYFRLSVVRIPLPPLRDRPEDIPSLVWAIVQRRQRALNRSIGSVPKEVMDALQAYSWPGNIRELENVIERALINGSGDALTLSDDDLEKVAQPSTVMGADLFSVERSHIEAVLHVCHWRINGSGNAAERLGLHPNTLRFRMKKLGIARPGRPASPLEVANGSSEPAHLSLTDPARAYTRSLTGCVKTPL
jgi:transcriptional regulator with GAF, ATPase, and Fis domain